VIGDGMDPGPPWKQALDHEIGLERADIEPT
jgi:hypothetical protein